MEQKTATCPICKGWGLEPIPINKNSHTCSNCEGNSIQAKAGNIVMFWDMPGFIDYKGRQNARLAKIILITSFFGILAFSVITVIILGYQSITNL